MSKEEKLSVKLNENDNVATVLRNLQINETTHDINAVNPIPKGHKISLKNISKGDKIIKYDQLIGIASKDILVGEHVHVENTNFRSTDHEYEFSTSINLPNMIEPANRPTFKGYKRPNGKVGTRNYIGILTSVNCSATAARNIANIFTDEKLAQYPNVDGVVSFTHGTGCGMADSGDGFDALQRVLLGYIQHPNLAGILLIGLGCEANQIKFLLDAFNLNENSFFHTMTLQEMGGLRKTIDAGVNCVEKMLPEVNAIERTDQSVEHLSVALQCGGSDAWSGITSNPSLGHAADLIVKNGGTAILAETPEIYGAEHMLTRRAITPEVGKKLIDRILWWEDYVTRNKGSMDNNPSPGNKAGGLTTILEKSLGAAAKGGTTPLNDVLLYAQKAEKKGFLFMDSPGYDPASVTGQIASGCNVVTFTTGRGSCFGCKPSPSIKIATNTEMYNNMIEDMDVNAGKVITENKDIEDVGQEIFDLIVKIASGEKSKSEYQGLGDLEFVPWQIGATM
jgi:altronate hydrolase